MKLNFRLAWLCLVLLGASFLFAACELNDDAEDSVSNPSLSIDPTYQLISRGSTDSVFFRCAGGTPPYSWSLSQTNDTLGTLSATNDIAVYTPKAVDGSQFLTVRDHSGASATATLVQQ